LFAHRGAVLNLIPYNAVPGMPWQRPAWEHAAAMARELHRRGVLTKLRRSAAQDVDGGCGQLRARVVAMPQRRGASARGPSDTSGLASPSATLGEVSYLDQPRSQQD
jgi:23S rRNA (adenine2503-C2)-methyltransferase